MDELYFRLAHKIHILAHKIDMAAEQTLADISLTGYKFLHILNKKGAQNQADLCKFCAISGAAASKRITQLLDKQYIQSSINPDNRRENIISITKEGKQKLKQCNKKLTVAAKELLKHGEKLDELEKQLDILLEPFMKYCK